MVILFLIVFGLYFLLLLALLYGWESAMQKNTPQALIDQPITVIVPMRNEAEHVESLIASIQKQSYPTEKLQVLLVNDHSIDETATKLSQNLPKHFVLIDLPKDVSGKKAAITRAISNATGDIIVTTDADCSHNADWLKSINDQFESASLQLLVGPVSIKANRFFAKLQAIEFSSLIGSGAALLQFRIPAMANGANLAFRKIAFEKVNGYEGNQHIASGDDEFLLKKIHQTFPEGVAFNNDEHAVVETEAQPTVAAFVQQRLRWASKWKHNSSWSSKLVAVIVFLFQVGILSLLVAVILYPNRPLQLIVLSKFAIDGIFLWRVSSFLKSKFSLLPFLILEFIYPIYVIIIALLSQLVRYRWKGRTF